MKTVTRDTDHAMRENVNRSKVTSSDKHVQKSDIEEMHVIKSKATQNNSIQGDDYQDHEALMGKIKQHNEKTMKSSAWITTGLVLTALGAGMLLFWPQFKANKAKIEQQNQKIELLEKEISQNNLMSGEDNNGLSIPKFSSELKGDIQGGLQEKMDQIQNQARNISNTVEQLSKKAQEISEEKIENGTQALSDRLDQLETKIKEGTASIEGPDMEGLPTQELKAAAILVAFSQFRNSLDREAPFEEDLVLLQKLIGDDNPELTAKLNELSVHADDGVLTASGLASELKKMTGDIVVSSLQGEDVSIKEKAKARFGSILQVEKDGEVISGTKTQTTVSKAQEYVEQGKIEDSIVTLEGLDEGSAKIVQPFIEKAKASLLAQQVKKMISTDILSETKMQKPDLSMDALPQSIDGIKKIVEDNVSMMGNDKVIKDEKSGLSILPKSSTGFKGLLDKQ